MAKFTRKRKTAQVEQSQQTEPVIEQPVIEQPAIEPAIEPESKKDDQTIDSMVTRLKTAFSESRAQSRPTTANFVIQVRLPADCEPMYKALPTLAKREVKGVFESAIRSAYKLIEESGQ